MPGPAWVGLLEAAGRRPLAIDLPGHGSAAKPPDPAADAAMAPDIPAWLDARSGPDAGQQDDVVGSSAGGHPFAAALLGGIAVQGLIVLGDRDFSGSADQVAAGRRVMRAVLPFITERQR